MKNTIVSYANLSKDLKVAFKEWLGFGTRDLISFPFQGKHMKGYIFNHQGGNLLVVMQLAQYESINDNLEELDINEEF